MGVSASTDAGTVEALNDAARLALLAPSILNTQPWTWRIRGASLSLFADHERRVESVDPNGRLLTLSCGGALHHAYTALTAHGHETVVKRFPDPSRPDLLAVVSVIGGHSPTHLERHLASSILDRRSDRRAIAATSRVSPEVMARLRDAAEAHGAELHRIADEQRPFLGMAARHAQTTEEAQSPYKSDLVAWTVRRARGEGVPVETLVATTARAVPLRDFADGGETGMHPGFGDDRWADFLVIATTGDTPTDWLRAGEAMSAVWLTATGHGIAASVLSDVVEVPGARSLVAGLLPGRCHPQLVFRIGVAAQPTPPPASPRRDPQTVIIIDEDAP